MLDKVTQIIDSIIELPTEERQNLAESVRTDPKGILAYTIFVHGVIDEPEASGEGTGDNTGTGTSNDNNNATI